MDPDYEQLVQIASCVDLLPLKEVSLAFEGNGVDSYGEFDKSRKRHRQWVNELVAELARKIEAQNEEFVIEEYQIFSAPRRWRGLLWNSATHGFALPAKRIADVLMEQWRAAARIPRDEPFQQTLVKKAIREYLRLISMGGHSESLTTRSLLCIACMVWLLRCKFAEGAWQRIDTSLDPFDGITAAANCTSPDGRQIAVVCPVANQWDPHEPMRLAPYLEKLSGYFRDLNRDFELHSPRIGSAMWIDFPRIKS